MGPGSSRSRRLGLSSRTEQIVEHRVAQLRAKVEGTRTLPDRIQIGGVVLCRRERYALRRYARQLVSKVREDADREVLYLDPALAKMLAVKGLVELLEGRHPDKLFFDGRGYAVWAGLDLPPEVHVPATPTKEGTKLIESLLRMRGD